MVAQQLPREQHVLGAQRLAVGEAGPGIDVERDKAPLVVGLDRSGEQAVERERLVIAAREQALDHVVPHLLHGQSLDDEGIEAVEGAENAPGQPATLGGIRIDVGHVGEIGRHRRLAVHGNGVGFLGPCAACRESQGERQPQGESQDAEADAQTFRTALHKALEHEHLHTLIRGPAGPESYHREFPGDARQGAVKDACRH
ncbi:hypothetical protein ACVWW5_004356 [Bradyrhizobium sp. LM3.4]